MKAKEQKIKVSKIPAGEAYIPGGTRLNVELVNEMTSKKNKKGDILKFKLLDNLILNNVVVVPVGTEVIGKVTEAASSGFSAEPENYSLVLITYVP